MAKDEQLFEHFRSSISIIIIINYDNLYSSEVVIIIIINNNSKNAQFRGHELKNKKGVKLNVRKNFFSQRGLTNHHTGPHRATLDYFICIYERV